MKLTPERNAQREQQYSKIVEAAKSLGVGKFRVHDVYLKLYGFREHDDFNHSMLMIIHDALLWGGAVVVGSSCGRNWYSFEVNDGRHQE